jgi:hypothetical protein
MAENPESAVSDTDTRGASTSASRHHQDRSRTTVTAAAPTSHVTRPRNPDVHFFFWVPLIHTVLQCMERGLTSSSDLAQYKKLPSTRAVCATAVAAVGGEDPWVNIVRTYVADFGRRGMTGVRSRSGTSINGNITAESQEHHTQRNAPAPGASLVSDYFLATFLWSPTPGSVHLRLLAGAVFNDVY